MENTTKQTVPELLDRMTQAISYLRTCESNTGDILTSDILMAVTEELDVIAATLEREYKNTQVRP